MAFSGEAAPATRQSFVRPLIRRLRRHLLPHGEKDTFSGSLENVCIPKCDSGAQHKTRPPAGAAQHGRAMVRAA